MTHPSDRGFPTPGWPPEDQLANVLEPAETSDEVFGDSEPFDPVDQNSRVYTVGCGHLGDYAAEWDKSDGWRSLEAHQKDIRDAFDAGQRYLAAALATGNSKYRGAILTGDLHTIFQSRFVSETLGHPEVVKAARERLAAYLRETES
jgi:hypothetical protein